MKKIAFLFLIVAFASAKAQELDSQISHCDSLLFSDGFNTCHFASFDTLISPDLEFYHDKSGITLGKKEFIQTLQKGICRPERKQQIRRDLLEQKHFLMLKGDERYAVLQTGKHQFTEVYPDGKEVLGSVAQFSHLWVKKGNKWLLSRVFSYDHRSIEMDLSMELDAHLSRAMEMGYFNGSALIAKGGKIWLSKGYGLRNFEEGISHTPESIFSIYSITKSITATVILQLVEEQKINLSDKLDQFFPAFKHGQKITIRQLLSHTSGLYDYTRGYPETDFSEKTMLPFLDKKALEFEPGSRFTYCNSGYSILGFLAQQVDKKSFAQILKDRIFDPLGMKNSGFDYKNLLNKNKSTPYSQLGAKVQVKAEIYPFDVPFSGGAIYSTTEDLYRFHKGILERTLLGSRLQTEAYVPVKEIYGLGWMVDTIAGLPIVWHNGGAQGFRSVLLRNEKEDVCVILLSNTETPPDQLGAELVTLLQGKKLPKRTPVAIESNKLPAYTGCFEDGKNLLLRFWSNGEKLTFKAPGSPEITLIHEGENRFFDELGQVPIMFYHKNDSQFDSLEVKTRRGFFRLGRKSFSFGLVGSSTTNGWLGPDIQMTETKPGIWENHELKLKEGELKIRANNQWAINFGGELNKTWLENGPNLNVKTGTYHATWDESKQRLFLEVKKKKK